VERKNKRRLDKEEGEKWMGIRSMNSNLARNIEEQLRLASYGHKFVGNNSESVGVEGGPEFILAHGND
jgi:hypothetical protein